MKLNRAFWTNRYLNNEIGWDIGSPSTPIKTYIDQLTNKNLKILIPGAGNAYEAEYLFKLGFLNTFVLDISEEPLKSFKERVPQFPHNQLINDDFFNHEGKYDLIIEQTFFCAIAPKLRDKYVTKMTTLLKPKGKLVGLLFDIPLNSEHPPYGGNKKEYLTLFSDKFELKTCEVAHNSITPRKDSELFIIFQKNN